MPCDYEFSDQEIYIIAAYYQNKYKQQVTRPRYRNNWVYQDDFMCHILIRNPPDDGHYIYVKEQNDSIVVSGMSDEYIDEDEVFHHQEILKWEPNIGPDGNVHYEYECMACGEGLHREYAECMACGFCKAMLTNVSNGRKIIDDHNRNLITEATSEGMWVM